MSILYFAVIVIIAYLAYTFAEQKGYNPWVAAIVTFFIPIACLIWVLLPKKK